MYQHPRVRRTYNQVTHRWTDILDRERDLLDLLGLEIPGLAPPRGKRALEEAAAAAAAEQDRSDEGSFAGPGGTSGGGARAEVVVLDEENFSGEEAVQVPDNTNVPVRVHTVVTGRVAPSKSKKNQGRSWLEWPGNGGWMPLSPNIGGCWPWRRRTRSLLVHPLRQLHPPPCPHGLPASAVLQRYGAGLPKPTATAEQQRQQLPPTGVARHTSAAYASECPTWSRRS
ncbi:uncharacterized protein LOC144792609 [Lissotriton helveticus]